MNCDATDAPAKPWLSPPFWSQRHSKMRLHRFEQAWLTELRADARSERSCQCRANSARSRS